MGNYDKDMCEDGIINRSSVRLFTMENCALS